MRQVSTTNDQILNREESGSNRKARACLSRSFCLLIPTCRGLQVAQKALDPLLAQEARPQIGWVGIGVEALTRVGTQFPGIDEVFLQVGGSAGGASPSVLLGDVPGDIVGSSDPDEVDGAKWTAFGILVIAAKSSNRQQICQRLRGRFSNKFRSAGIRLTSAIPIDQPIARARAIRIVSCSNACERGVISIQLEPA
jgi:hypothetical protein